MTQIDQFESIFRAASRSVYTFQDWNINQTLVISDGTRKDAETIRDQVSTFLGAAMDVEHLEWTLTSGDDFSSVRGLLQLVETHQPSLVVCRRNLHVKADEFVYSLGVYVEVLTQVMDIPVLLLPTTEIKIGETPWHAESKNVLAVTDHLDNDSLLVNSALKMTAEGGRLILAHIEDERMFERYMHAIERIAEIDSDVARDTIRERLLLDPKNFIDSCRTEIEKHEPGIQIESLVKMGRTLADYRNLVRSHEVDLVVLHTRDEDQLAMHGLAYPLCVELHETPLLLI